MATPSPVRLLIADRSENRAHEIDSVLRNAGIATRSEFCGDLSDESVTEQAIDLAALPLRLRSSRTGAARAAQTQAGPADHRDGRFVRAEKSDARSRDGRNRRRVRRRQRALPLCRQTRTRKRLSTTPLYADAPRAAGSRAPLRTVCWRTPPPPSRTCTKACTSTRTTITSSCSVSKTRTNCSVCRCST